MTGSSGQEGFPLLKVISALRHRNFRLYWSGVIVSVIGWQVQVIGIGWLVYRLTGSPFYLGLVGLFTALPTISLSLVGGVMADRFDRQRLVLITQAGAGLSSLILATLTVTGIVQVWQVLLLASVNGTVQAFDTPARQALLPDLVEREDLVNAVALSSAAWQLARVVGPALAGGLIAFFSEAVCFYATACGYGIMLLMLLRLKFSKQVLAAQQNLRRNWLAGFSFVARTPLFAIIIGLTLTNSLFGMSYTTLMPAFAKDILKVGPEGYGLLMTAGGLGAIGGSLVIAILSARVKRGRFLITGPLLFGCLLMAFAISRHFNTSLLILGLCGFANALYMVTGQSVLQAEVPNELRGRVMGIYGLTWSMMPLSGMIGGSVASLTGEQLAVGLSGLVVLGVAVYVVSAFPQIRRLA